jgi:N-acetylneuraminic acid mutarotase
MVTPHAFHASALLLDGSVLVAGGLINDRLDGQISAFAEVYDPGSETWTSIRDMRSARFGHTATLLSDGTLLVSGGYVRGGDPLASAELYDPKTRSWVATGRMRQGRGGHTATLLADGTVLVAGSSFPSAPTASSEVYDPVTRSWTATGKMGTSRHGQTATLLVDGRVLVVGGGDEVSLAEGPAYSPTAELYDPTSGRWTKARSMAKARAGHTATLLADGRVFVVGGSAGDDATARSAELYDPSSGTWSVAAKMRNARWSHTATLLGDGRVLVVGGFGLGSDPQRLSSAEVYDPRIDRWTDAGDMTIARSTHTATMLLDGSVLVVGDYEYKSRASAELYVPGPGS